MGWVWIRVHAFYFQFHLEDILLIQIFSDKDFCAFFARFPHCSDMDFCAALTCSFYLASASASSSLLDIPSLTSYIIILFSFEEKNVCFLFTTYNLQLMTCYHCHLDPTRELPSNSNLVKMILSDN